MCASKSRCLGVFLSDFYPYRLAYLLHFLKFKPFRRAWDRERNNHVRPFQYVTRSESFSGFDFGLNEIECSAEKLKRNTFFLGHTNQNQKKTGFIATSARPFVILARCQNNPSQFFFLQNIFYWLPPPPPSRSSPYIFGPMIL